MDRRKFMENLATITVAGAASLNLNFVDGKDKNLERVKKGIPKRILGKTGVEVTTLILGGVSGMMQKPTTEFHPAELANAALDLGINYFDTAASYGAGQSELNYGVVLAKRRNEVFLATKTGNRTYDGAMREVEESLKRLQTDHLDLYQIHGVTAREDITLWGKPDGVMKALYKLRDEKVTRFIGGRFILRFIIFRLAFAAPYLREKVIVQRFLLLPSSEGIIRRRVLGLILLGEQTLEFINLVRHIVTSTA